LRRATVLANIDGNRTQFRRDTVGRCQFSALSSPLSDGSSEADQSVVRFPVQVIHGKGLSGQSRYVNRAYSHSTLAGLYRAARVGLVTPLRLLDSRSRCRWPSGASGTTRCSGCSHTTAGRDDDITIPHKAFAQAGLEPVGSRSSAARKRDRGLQFLDLIQEGNIGPGSSTLKMLMFAHRPATRQMKPLALVLKLGGAFVLSLAQFPYLFAVDVCRNIGETFTVADPKRCLGAVLARIDGVAL
jgi:hypothetical protein